MNFPERVEQVFPDWTYGHPKVLYGLIRAMQPEMCVEVGTYLGYGAAWMAQALLENGKGHLYCIDNWSLNDRASQQGNPRAAFERNIAALGLTHLVTVIQGNSHEVQWPDKVDFAYIDGWHSYTAARLDFENCSSRGAQCVCFDDTTQSVGPRMVVDVIRESSGWDVLDLHHDCGMTICVRKRDKGAVTFSQEIPNHPGVDLQTLTYDEQLSHFVRVKEQTGVDYRPILPFICRGTDE